MPPHPESLIERLKGKRLGVVLSAGYFGFFGHAGFVRALQDAGLQPMCWGGTSAGALVAALAAGGLDADGVAGRLTAVRRSDFWDFDPIGALTGLARGMGATGLLRGRRFRELLERALPVQRFDQCRTPLLVVATNLSRGGPQAFTRGDLAPRVQASCAYPGLFRAVDVDGEKFWDGGLVDKAPVLALHEAFAPEAILVHYLPSRAQRRVPRGPLAYPQALNAAVAALRRDHFDLQLEVLRRAGVPVAVVSTDLDAVGPHRLQHGSKVLQDAWRMSLEALNGPAEQLK